jgi:hypothetical protein
MNSGIAKHITWPTRQVTLKQPAQPDDFSRLISPARKPFQGTWPNTQALPDNRVSRQTMQRRHQAIPLQQAAQESPTFSLLMGRVRDSSERLQAIRSLLPAPLRAGIQAGPIEDGTWCLLVSSNAVAAKLRQLLPALQAHLNGQGLGVSSIRIKVQSR